MMKKVILGTTLATSLLLVGGITASATIGDPVTAPPIAVTITEPENGVSFTFNTLTLNEFEISEDLLDGTQEGTIENVGGTLTNLTRDSMSVTIRVSSGSDGIYFSNSLKEISLTAITADPIARSTEGEPVDFTFNRQTALLDGTPTITVTASDTTDSGNGQQL